MSSGCARECVWCLKKNSRSRSPKYIASPVLVDSHGTTSHLNQQHHYLFTTDHYLFTLTQTQVICFWCSRVSRVWKLVGRVVFSCRFASSGSDRVASSCLFAVNASVRVNICIHVTCMFRLEQLHSSSSSSSHQQHVSPPDMPCLRKAWAITARRLCLRAVLGSRLPGVRPSSFC